MTDDVSQLFYLTDRSTASINKFSRQLTYHTIGFKTQTGSDTNDAARQCGESDTTNTTGRKIPVLSLNYLQYQKIDRV